MNKIGIVNALKAARPYLVSGEDGFVCLALMSADFNNEISRAEYSLAEKYIKELLGPTRETLEEWINQVHGIPMSILDSSEGAEKMRITRIAWVDALIKELSV